jgi:enoyl-CoA hydratase/carnithine racemase
MADAADTTDAPAKVLCETRDGLAIVSISNAKKRNALNPDLLLALEAMLDRLAQSDVRAVVLRGAGERIFSSGYDITAIRGGAGDEASRHPLGRAIDAIERFPFPVLAMAFGGAYGAACEVLAACDLRYADAPAQFAIPAARLSVVYDAAGIGRLASRASATLVRELLLTARPMAAARALELGLLNGVYPTEELEPAVMALAREIAGLAPRSLAATKSMLAALAERGHFSPTEVAHFTALRNQALASPDFAEGQRAFAEKRPPRFSGR